MTINFENAIAKCIAVEDDSGIQLIRRVLDYRHDQPPLSKDELQQLHNEIRQTIPKEQDKVALIYGGATKIKEYVFEAPRLPEMRGASVLLDWVTESILPSLWGVVPNDAQTKHAHGIIYAGGNTFLGCAAVSDAPALAHSIEHAYTTHTLTADSVAVWHTCSLLELRYGRLQFDDDGRLCYWVEDFIRDWADPARRAILEQYYYPPKEYGIASDDMSEEALRTRFFNRKTFGELVTILKTKFNRRRDERCQEGHPIPFYALLPWDEKCDSSDLRPSVWCGTMGNTTEQHTLSEASARKHYVGQVVKNEQHATRWYTEAFDWVATQDVEERSWERQWTTYLQQNLDLPYAKKWSGNEQPARDLHQIGAASNPEGYIGIIYADSNNVGRLIATRQTMLNYATISYLLSDAANHAVFRALAETLEPHAKRHPFEILAIGGDHLLLIVPGNQACDIALAIGYFFEEAMAHQLGTHPSQPIADRYHGKEGIFVQKFQRLHPKLGLSAGVIIAHDTAPMFFLDDLAEELLKSAKKLAKRNAQKGYHGGAIDFMVMKSVTMVTSKMNVFRKKAFGDYDTDADTPNQTNNEKERQYRLTARPYTWHEFAGLLETVRALKKASIPRSQLYRLRGVLYDALAEGKGVTHSIMEYLHTCVRLNATQSHTLRTHIDQYWCTMASTDTVSRIPLPPWIRLNEKQWETIWADIVELYDMIDANRNLLSKRG